MSKRWYVVHAYSGFEKSVQRALVDRIARSGMQDMFGQILVPVEEVVDAFPALAALAQGVGARLQGVIGQGGDFRLQRIDRFDAAP